VLFGVHEREIRLVATDGHRLALVARRSPKRGETCRVSPAQGRPGDCPHRGSGEDVQVASADNQFHSADADVLLMARLIEGTFPNYEQVVPKAHPHKIAVSRSALTAALRRVSVLSEEAPSR